MGVAAFAMWLGGACTDVTGNVIVAGRADSGLDSGATAGPACASGCGPRVPLCDPMSNTCVECITRDDCLPPKGPYCDQSLHVCAECLMDVDCPDPLERCSKELHRCAAPCKTESDCRMDDPKCDLAIAVSTGYCVRCSAQGDCTDPQRSFCSQGECVSCDSPPCP